MRDTGVDTKEKTTRIYCEQINSSLGTMLIEFGYVPKTARARFFPLYSPIHTFTFRVYWYSRAKPVVMAMNV